MEDEGRAFYSFPRTVDVPAMAELLIYEDNVYEVPRKEQRDFKVDGTVEPMDLSRLADCESIMMQHHDSIGFCRSISDKDLQVLKEQTERIFKACTNLTELHWHGAMHISDIIGENSGPYAQEVMRSLEVLSIPNSFRFAPEDLEDIG